MTPTAGMPLRYTGHPFLDVGVATITAFAGKKLPAEVTHTDLARIADYIEARYSKNPMKSFLTSIYTNAGFTQPAFERRPARRAAYARRVLRGWQRQGAPGGTDCVFFGTPAVEFANAQMMPLSAATFHPGGIEALPVSGEALLALQAFPLGCLRCGGRALLLHSDNTAATHAWARHALHITMRALEHTEGASGSRPAFPAARHPRTQAAALLAAERTTDLPNDSPFSMNAYHFSNNRRQPALTIYSLPRQVTAFLREASRPPHRAVWEQLVGRAWARGAPETASSESEQTPDTPATLLTHRNTLYEELFNLPGRAAHFLRACLLPLPAPLPELETSLSIVSWPLVHLFLERVVNMEREEIERVRVAADMLADHIRQKDDEQLFRFFLRRQRKGGYAANGERLRLIETGERALHPCLAPEEWAALLDGSGEHPTTWMMTRDLLLARMTEQLHAGGWMMPRHRALMLTNTEQY